jgi:ComF family protein
MSFIVKNTTFPNLLDLIAPHSCRGCHHIGNALCDRCKNNIILDHINNPPQLKLPKSFPPIFAISDRTGLINHLIHDFKYNSTRALAKPLAEILDQALPSIPNPVTIIPLPTTSSHIRARGLDHTYLISKHLAKIRHYQIINFLIRNNNSVQVGADRKARLHQAKTAYKVNPNIQIDPDTTYILFDDVWTTGASMRAAVKKLRQSGAKKIVICLLAISRFNQN